VHAVECRLLRELRIVLRSSPYCPGGGCAFYLAVDAHETTLTLDLRRSEPPSVACLCRDSRELSNVRGG